jgi:hypothetical protein
MVLISGGADSHSAGPKIHYDFQKTRPLVLILNKLNPVRYLCIFYNTLLNIVFPYMWHLP